MNPATLSSYGVVVALVSMLLGVITQAANTGKLFGKFTVSPQAMVYLLIVAPFLGGVSASLLQAGALSAASAFYAVIAGVEAVVAGAAPGLAVHAAIHAHLTVPGIAAALRKPASNDNAAAAQPGKAA